MSVPVLDVLEFYSGLGGMHYALAESGICFNVIGALDINTLANHVYKFNFPKTKLLQKNIEGLTRQDLDKLKADLWTMSPPCQPYTRQGKQEESNDTRAKSFLNLMKILKDMEFPPKYIFIENVKGFEGSDTRDLLVQALKLKDYKFQEMLVTPTDFGIPNSRLRYYLLAKLAVSFKYQTTDNVFEMSSISSDDGNLIQQNSLAKYVKSINSKCQQKLVKDFILNSNQDIKISDYDLPEDILKRFHNILDIVYGDSAKSCCFTKSYSKYIEGTGSVYSCLPKDEIDKSYQNINATTTNLTENEKLQLLLRMNLRYFTPCEVSSLMCFPKEAFSFPDDVTRKQKYRLLGNSINVHVVAVLMKYFLFEQENMN